MTQPPPEISKRRANMIWPVRVGTLPLQPWKHVLQFVVVRRESEAVSEIYTAITRAKSFAQSRSVPKLPRPRSHARRAFDRGQHG
jgi:hypothetical protein